MTDWIYRIKIKALYADAFSIEDVKKAGAQIAQRIRSSKWYADDLKLADGDLLHCALEQVADEISDPEGREHLEEVLGALFDLADADKAWIE